MDKFWYVCISDLSLIEQYNASIKDLCNIYSVPAVLVK